MKTNKKKQIKIPTKTTINLAANLEKKTNVLLAIPAIVLIVIGASAISKFFVVDRYVALSQAQREVSYIQGQVDYLYEEYNSMGDIAEIYAHYTYSGMTAEESVYFNRSDVIKLIDRTIIPEVTVGRWQLKANVLTVPMQAPTLEIIKNVVSRLEMESLVEFCIVNNAVTTDATPESDEYVTANVTIYLNNSERGNF